MARKITKQGHTVKGALAAYFAPRLAADKALKPGELDKLFQDEKLKVAPYKKQIPILVDAAKALTKDRLAKDADVEDLAELLEALSGEDLDEDFEEGEDKGLVKDEDDMGMDDAGTELMKCLAECSIPEELLEKINGLVSQLGKPAAAQDDFPPAKPAAKPAVAAGPAKPAANAAPMKEVPVTKPALDAALAANTKATQTHIASLFTAARDVEPILGRVDALAFDSADAMYRMALDQAGVKTEGVHPTAYKTLLQFASERPTPAFDSTIAADSAAAAVEFEKQYTHIPAQA